MLCPRQIKRLFQVSARRTPIRSGTTDGEKKPQDRPSSLNAPRQKLPPFTLNNPGIGWAKTTSCASGINDLLG
jgi:hypothetical protein